MSRFTELTYLQLANNQLQDITSLGSLSALKRLNVENNQISDITVLSDLTALQSVLLTNNQIDDIGPLVINSQNGGLGKWEAVYLNYGMLKPDTNSKAASDIQALRGNGVLVNYVALEDK